MLSIIITGATGDLGRIVVPRLAREFACIAVYRSAASWARFPHTPGVEGAESFERALELAPSPHALIHLAGGFTAGETPSDFTKMFETNVIPAVESITAIAPYIVSGGRLVVMSAEASLSAPAGLGAYVASKAALNALILTQSSELKPRRITANALLPTSIGPDAVTAEQIAGAFLFLLSEAASGVTGQLIVMKG